MKPLIGITLDIFTKSYTYYNQKVHYTQAINQAGGNPILLSPYSDIDWLKENLDGLLIPGGLDIIPEAYGEHPHPLNYIQNPLRFNFEKNLYESISQNLPVLGICYGCQFLNVLHGGTLIQHLPDVLNNTDHQSNKIFEYTISTNSKIYEILKKTKVQGESFHHQAVKNLGKGLTISAYAEDGIVEAIETNDERWVIGVQWHPERTLNHPDSQQLFHSFIEACHLYKSNKNA